MQGAHQPLRCGGVIKRRQLISAANYNNNNEEVLTRKTQTPTCVWAPGAVWTRQPL